MQERSAVASSRACLDEMLQLLIAGCYYLHRAGQRMRGGSAVAASARLDGRHAAKRLAAERHYSLFVAQRLQGGSVAAGGYRAPSGQGGLDQKLVWVRLDQKLVRVRLDQKPQLGRVHR